jgi:hypothetical protein
MGSLGHLLVSLLLGIIAMGLFWFYYPDEFVLLQRIAATMHEWIISRGWSPRVESILRFLLEDRQLILMSFVVMTRILLGLLMLLLRGVWSALWPSAAHTRASAARR